VNEIWRRHLEGALTHLTSTTADAETVLDVMS